MCVVLVELVEVRKVRLSVWEMMLCDCNWVSVVLVLVGFLFFVVMLIGLVIVILKVDVWLSSDGLVLIVLCIVSYVLLESRLVLFLLYVWFVVVLIVFFRLVLVSVRLVLCFCRWVGLIGSLVVVKLIGSVIWVWVKLFVFVDSIEISRKVRKFVDNYMVVNLVKWKWCLVV